MNGPPMARPHCKITLIDHYLNMSVADLKRVVNELSREERQWLAAYLHELERQPDDRRLAELDERMADMDAGRKRAAR
jgi:hypothetical protein